MLPKLLSQIIRLSFSSQRTYITLVPFLNPLSNRKPVKLHSRLSEMNTMLSCNVSSRVQVSVLGNGGVLSPSIVLNTDKSSYVFNCGEGTQRMIFEHNKYVKIGKVKNVFFTSSHYDNWSGLFGFILTIAPISKQLNVLGPSRLQEIYGLYRNFMAHSSEVELSFVSTDHDVVQDLVDDDDFLIRSLRLAGDSSSPVIYFVILKNKTGQLLIDKCKEFKIPPGPLFTKIKNGESIEISGRVISPEDVLGPPEVGPSFVILECPSTESMESLVKLDFGQYLQGRPLEVVFHLTPQSVANDAHYVEWLRQFESSTKHVVLNEHNSNQVCLTSSSLLQAKLNMVDKEIFKKLNEKQIEAYQLPDEQSSLVSHCPTLFTYRLRPLKNKEMLIDPEICKINYDQIQSDLSSEPEIAQRLESYRSFVQSQAALNKVTRQNDSFKPNILFLGTASSNPGKQRNTSAILLNLESSQSILFDCGEATFAQLNRYYGKENIDEIIFSIKVIYISHYHADHHFGLVKLLMERAKRDLEPLFIVAPNPVLKFLEAYSETVENFKSYYVSLSCKSVLNGSDLSVEVIDLKNQLLRAVSLDNLVTVEVPHCYESFGIVITHRQEKIAYSGDSMFSHAFDQVAKDCLLMIHEATMNDDLVEEAKLKRHSTISDAISVGRNINARYLLLTHFSQRYAKFAPISLVQDQSHANYIDQRVGVSFDFMNVVLDELWKVAKLKQPLEVLFDEEIQKMQDVSQKRSLKRKLIEGKA